MIIPFKTRQNIITELNNKVKIYQQADEWTYNIEKKQENNECTYSDKRTYAHLNLIKDKYSQSIKNQVKIYNSLSLRDSKKIIMPPLSCTARLQDKEQSSKQIGFRYK